MPGTIWTKNKGHVPTRHVARAIEDKLRDVSGIAVPGMPRGSPNGNVEASEVLTFGADRKAVVFHTDPREGIE